MAEKQTTEAVSIDEDEIIMEPEQPLSSWASSP